MSDFKVGEFIYFAYNGSDDGIDVKILKGKIKRIILECDNIEVRVEVNGIEYNCFRPFKNFEEAKNALINRVNALQEES